MNNYVQVNRSMAVIITILVKFHAGVSRNKSSQSEEIIIVDDAAGRKFYGFLIQAYVFYFISYIS